MERKRIAVALAAIAIVGLFAGGSVYAYFSDIEGTDDNTFTAGTLDLEVGDISLKTVDIEDVYPGWTSAQTITVENVGSINGVLTVKFANVVNAPGGTPEPERALGTEDLGELGTAIKVTISIDNDGTGLSTPTTIDALKAGTIIDLGKLASGGSATITLTYTIDYDTIGNEIMEDTVTFDLEFYLVQDKGNEITP